MKDIILMTPGPTMVPEDVKKEAGKQPLHHRTEEFYEIFSGLNKNLKKIFNTKQEVITLTSSGTGGLEAVIANLFSPEDKVLVASVGYFGERFFDIAKAYGLDPQIHDFGWGNSVDPEVIENKLKSEKYKAVLITQNETSTGVTNNIKEIAQIANKFETPIIVDAVSSLGGIPLETDEWGVDAVITCSQKCFMSPPGLSFVCLSERAWEMNKSSKLPKYYFNLKKAKEGLLKERQDTPYTPAVSNIMAVKKATDMLLEIGMDNVYKRQAYYGATVREMVKSIGLEILPKEKFASDLITAVKIPDGFKSTQIIKFIKENYNILLTGGQGPLKGKIIRIGHMGYITHEMLSQTFEALKAAFSQI